MFLRVKPPHYAWTCLLSPARLIVQPEPVLFRARDPKTRIMHSSIIFMFRRRTCCSYYFHAVITKKINTLVRSPSTDWVKKIEQKSVEELTI